MLVLVGNIVWYCFEHFKKDLWLCKFIDLDLFSIVEHKGWTKLKNVSHFDNLMITEMKSRACCWLREFFFFNLFYWVDSGSVVKQIYFSSTLKEIEKVHIWIRYLSIELKLDWFESTHLSGIEIENVFMLTIKYISF